jgi:hypothetical protein
LGAAGDAPAAIWALICEEFCERSRKKGKTLIHQKENFSKTTPNNKKEGIA